MHSVAVEGKDFERVYFGLKEQDGTRGSDSLPKHVYLFQRGVYVAMFTGWKD